MALSTNDHAPESEDAFSDIPDFLSKPHDTGTGFKKIGAAGQGKDKTRSGKQTSAGGPVDPETGTGIYIGKKVTDSHEIKKPTKIKDTTLTDISIDTDFVEVDKKNAAAANKDAILTETVVTSTNHIDGNQVKPSVSKATSKVENGSPAIAAQSGTGIPVVMSKKDKAAPPNISLDINSGEYQQKLPSANGKQPLGSGVITGLLGTGGMAKVYRIWNEKLEVYRAVKILIPTNQKITWTRFLTEAKISAKLHHPNIIEVHSIGDWHGIPYIEMDIVEGETLSSIISRFKALPSLFVSAVIVQVARALAYAHSQEIVIYGKSYKGLIHRDLKPSNIMVGSNGVVKLMDFGVARPVETGLHTIDTENIVGTVHYFSPELISGYPIDPLSDIYSFGAVVYEMLSGSNPFPQTTMIQLIRAKEKNQFVRLEDYAKPIEPHLASVAQVCLRTDKSGRFQSAAELCNHLEQLHRKFNCGTAEDVVVRFLKDPQSVYKESEIFQETKNEPSSIQEATPVVRVVEQETRIERVGGRAIADETTVENDSEYLRIKRKHNTFFVVLTIILLILLVAGGIFLFSNNILLISSFWSHVGLELFSS